MKRLFVAIFGLVVLTGCEEINFACDETSARAAADLINEKMDSFAGALELSEPELIKSEQNHIYCRAKANVHVKYINYELVRKSNGDIYVFANPIGDAIGEAFEDIGNAIDDISRGIDFDDYDW